MGEEAKQARKDEQRILNLALERDQTIISSLQYRRFVPKWSGKSEAHQLSLIAR